MQVTICDAGSIDWLLRAMQTHPDDGDLQEYATLALDKLRELAFNTVFFFLQEAKLMAKQMLVCWVGFGLFVIHTFDASQMCCIQGRLSRRCHNDPAQPPGAARIAR
jgi:hypothetical protein